MCVCVYVCVCVCVCHTLHTVCPVEGLVPEAVTAPLTFSSCVKVLLFEGGGGGDLMDSFLPDIGVARSSAPWLQQHTYRSAQGLFS